MAYADDIAKKPRDTTVTIEITLTKPSSKTLYLTDRAGTYGGTLYEERIVKKGWGTSPQKCDPLTGDAALLTASFTVQDRKLNYQAAGKTFGDIVNGYAFTGATIEMKQWTYDESTWNNQPIFKGEITEIDEYDAIHQTIRFNASEAQKWNLEIPPTIIEEHDFPEAPDESMGHRVPLCYGSFHSADPLTYIDLGERLAVVPAVCIDKVGPTHGMELFRVCENDGTSAAHTLPTNPLFLWEPGLGELTNLRELSYDNPAPTNSSSFVQAEFDEWPYGRVPIIPVAIGTTDTSSNPGRAMDRDSNTYAEIDDAEILSLTIPSTSAAGQIKDIEVYVYWNKASVDGQLQWGLWNTDTSAWIQSSTETLVAGSGIDSDFFTVTTITALMHEWRFITADVNDNEFPIELRAIVNDDGGSRHCKVIGLVLRVQYYPQRNIKAIPPFTSKDPDRPMWG